VALLDAPLTGAADGAQAGTLTLMLGGDAEVIERCSPILELISERRFHLGPVGAGSVAKLLTNMLWFTHVVALTDALGAAARAGLEPAVFADVVRAGAADSWVAAHDLPNILAGDDDLSFTLALCQKDLSLISGLVAGLGVDVPLLPTVVQRFADAAARFGADAGELAVARLTEEAMGVSVRGA
jgi:3-hydroxyisobutyrate dehydrogenase